MRSIQALIDDRGEIGLGQIWGIDCAATAANRHNTLATLVGRDGGALNSLLKRLDGSPIELRARRESS